MFFFFYAINCKYSVISIHVIMYFLYCICLQVQKINNYVISDALLLLLDNMFFMRVLFIYIFSEYHRKWGSCHLYIIFKYGRLIRMRRQTLVRWNRWQGIACAWRTATESGLFGIHKAFQDWCHAQGPVARITSFQWVLAPP